MPRLYKNILMPLALGAMLLSSCRKQPDPEVPVPIAGSGTMKIEISNRFGDYPIKLSTEWYQNAAGDSLQITMFKYYLSNLVLVSDEGRKVSIPESYYLIDVAKPESEEILLENIPAGNYTGMELLIGVDSLHNTTGAQKGALDPVHGMIWTWSSGYIMAKMEGNSPQAEGGLFAYHISGYKEPSSGVKKVSLAFPAIAHVSAATRPNVHMIADAAEWFINPKIMSIAEYTNVMEIGKESARIAINYADMLTVDHIDE